MAVEFDSLFLRDMNIGRTTENSIESRNSKKECQHHLPAKKSYGDNFHALLTQTITITTSSDSKAPSTLQIALYKPLVVDLKYSVPPLWIIQSHLFGLSGIQEYVDLDPWVRRSPSIPYPLWKTLLDRSFVDRFQRNP